MTKNTALFIAIPIVLILLVVLLLPMFLDKEKVLQLASSTIKEQTGATLELAGPAELSLFPRLGIALEDASLTMPEEEQAGLRVGSLKLDLRLLPLLTGKVELQALRLDRLKTRIPAGPARPVVDTGNMTDEELNEYYAQRRAAQAEAGAAATGNALAVPLALNVKVLDVTDSSIEILDEDGSPSTTIKINSFLAKDLNLEARPMDLQATLEIVTQGTVALDLDGKVRFDEKNQLVLLDELALAITGVTPAALMLNTEGQVDLGRQVAEVELTLQTADAKGKGTVRYASFESPMIDAVLHFNRLDPALLFIAGPEAAAAPKPEATSGDDPLPLQALRGIDTRASLTVDEAVIGAHTLSELQGKLRIVDGVLRIKPLTAQVYGGALSMQATFNGKHNTAILNTRGTLDGLDIATALASLQEEPAATGTANLNWKLVGKGRTQNELVAAIKGPIQLSTSNTVLLNIGIESMLCQAVALTNQESLTASFPTDTAFTALSADIQLADGQAKLAPLTADLAHVSLRGNGAYDIFSQDFDVTLKAKLSPDLETLDRACRVSKRLTAIDWPVDCKGNMEGEPASWCKVDTQEIIEDLTKNEAERQIKKNAGKLLEKLFN